MHTEKCGQNIKFVATFETGSLLAGITLYCNVCKETWAGTVSRVTIKVL